MVRRVVGVIVDGKTPREVEDALGTEGTAARIRARLPGGAGPPRTTTRQPYEQRRAPRVIRGLLAKQRRSRLVSVGGERKRGLRRLVGRR